MHTLTNTNKYFDPLTTSRLPGRLDSDHSARLLGFQAHDIPVLMAAKLLQPLGKPVPNAPKYFAASTLEELRSDTAWLDAATKAVSRYWRLKNSSRSASQTPLENSPAA